MKWIDLALDILVVYASTKQLNNPNAGTFSQANGIVVTVKGGKWATLLQHSV